MGLFSRTGGVPPGQRHQSRQEYRLLEMERASKLTGLPLNLKPRGPKHTKPIWKARSTLVSSARRSSSWMMAHGSGGRTVWNS